MTLQSPFFFSLGEPLTLCDFFFFHFSTILIRDVSMVVRWKGKSPSSETQIGLVQVGRRSVVIRFRRTLVVSNLGGGVGGPRSGSRQFGPKGSPHSPPGGGGGAGGARPGAPPAFSPGVSSRRPTRRTRPYEEPPMFVGGASSPPLPSPSPSPSPSSSHSESETPRPLADSGDNGGDRGDDGGDGGRGNGKKLG